MSKRKSFIIHHDSLDVIDKLSDEQAGKLLKAIKSYQLGEEYELDLMTDLVFTPFKAQFKRDNEKYEKIVERNKNNGLKGGRPKTEVNPKEPSKPSGLSGNQSEPRKADSKSDSKSKSDSNNKDLIVPATQKRSKFNFNDEDYRFAEEMFKRVLVINPTAKKPSLDGWANTIRLMREIDKRTHADMWAAFDWANRDSFWCSNVLSPEKLRKQYDKLKVKANEASRPNTKQAEQDGLSDSRRSILEAREKRDAARKNSGSTMGGNGGALYDQVDEAQWLDSK